MRYPGGMRSPDPLTLRCRAMGWTSNIVHSPRCCGVTGCVFLVSSVTVVARRIGTLECIAHWKALLRTRTPSPQDLPVLHRTLGATEHPTTMTERLRQ